MPIVDGVGSTKLIRESELSAPEGPSHNDIKDENDNGATKGKDRKNSNSSNSNSKPFRVPIFAVSASLMEKDSQGYIDTGFDGWIMKPIDFHRVNHLLMGVREVEARNDSVYEPGMWEKGGWFERAIGS